MKSEPVSRTPFRRPTRAMYAVAGSYLGDAAECRTCLGFGRIRDDGPAGLRRCLDCGGSGYP